MRESPRLPPYLRVVGLLGAVLLGASIFLFSNLYSTILSSLSPASWRVLMMAVNLLILALTCLTIVRLYHIRVRMPPSEGGPFPLNGWKSQVAVVVVWTVIPLTAVVLAIFIPPTTDAFGFVFPATMLAGIALLTAWSLARISSGWIRTPGAG
jgi:hypothetical protein